jgi:hypothetical protein
MAIEPQVDDLQHMGVGVSGPDGATRMDITTGIARVNLYASSSATVKENFTVHVEPSLGPGQFRRAIATAAVARVGVNDWDPSTGDSMTWGVEDVQADFDDEAGKVELRFTVEVRTSGSGSTYLESVAFTVTTLAAMS